MSDDVKVAMGRWASRLRMVNTAGARAVFVAALAAVVGCRGDSKGDGRHGTSVQREWWKAIGQASAPARDAVLRDQGWVRVRNPEGLAAVATLPGRSQRPVVVYFFAKWFAPNEDLEREVLSDLTVRERLREFTLVYVDATDPDAGERKLKSVLEGETFPKIHVFKVGGELAASLRSDEAPVPSGSIGEVVGVDEFLSMLAVAEG